ncbi:hypothetical protein ACWEOZ_43955 [Actinoplanes sp. NPDC004185]
MNVVADMLLTDPAPLAIWVTLLLAATLSVLALAGVDGAPDPHLVLLDAVPGVRRLRAQRARRRADAAHAVRYADELVVATGRAARVAALWREHAEQSAQAADTAWQAWQDAEQRLVVLRAASAYAMPDARTTAEHAERERFLHRALRAAVGRGDLPAEALTEDSDWDRSLHPVEQERAVQRAIVAHRHALYQRAVMAEKAVRHDARLAVATRDSLRQETAVAVARAGAVRHLAPDLRPGPVSRPRRTVLAPA